MEKLEWVANDFIEYWLNQNELTDSWKKNLIKGEVQIPPGSSATIEQLKSYGMIGLYRKKI